MSKSYKLKDGNYIDSTGIVHNKQLLSEILNIQEIPLTINEEYIYYPSDSNVYCYKIGKLVIIEFCPIAFKTSPTTGKIIISGIPRPISPTIFALFGNNSAHGSTVRLKISSDNIMIHYRFS